MRRPQGRKFILFFLEKNEADSMKLTKGAGESEFNFSHLKKVLLKYNGLTMLS